METLSAEIDELENEKAKIEANISSGELPHDQLTALSQRIAQIIDTLDPKSERWLELMEIDENA